MSSSTTTPMERLINRKRTHHHYYHNHKSYDDDDGENDNESATSASDSDSDGLYENDATVESPSEYKKGGYHPVSIGEKYNEKYIIEKKLGFGYFSTVWLASDQTLAPNDPHKIVAIKISKSRQSFQDAAQDEMKILQTLGNRPFIVQLLDQFVIWGPNGKHYCLVFEPMWKDLYYLIRKFDYKGLPLKLLKVLTYQILCGVEYMHEKQIIHTDIKPENFLLSLPFDMSYDSLHQDRETYLDLKKHLRWFQQQEQHQNHTLSRNQRKRLREKMKASPTEPPTTLSPVEIQCKMQQLERMKMPGELNRSKNLIVKVADLGNACWTHKHYSSDITTRQYRSPEVLLGYPYGTGVDIFACGVMIFELATGELPFRPQKNEDAYYRNEDHLTLIYRTAGYLPRHMIKDGKYSDHYFNRRCEFRRHSVDCLEPRPLEDLLRRYNYNTDDAPALCDLLMHLIEPDPQKRWTATQAKQHPWLAEIHAAYQERGFAAFSLE